MGNPVCDLCEEEIIEDLVQVIGETATEPEVLAYYHRECWDQWGVTCNWPMSRCRQVTLKARQVANE